MNNLLEKLRLRHQGTAPTPNTLQTPESLPQDAKQEIIDWWKSSQILPKTQPELTKVAANFAGFMENQAGENFIDVVKADSAYKSGQVINTDIMGDSVKQALILWQEIYQVAKILSKGSLTAQDFAHVNAQITPASIEQFFIRLGNTKPIPGSGTPEQTFQSIDLDSAKNHAKDVFSALQEFANSATHEITAPVSPPSTQAVESSPNTITISPEVYTPEIYFRNPQEAAKQLLANNQAIGIYEKHRNHETNSFPSAICLPISFDEFGPTGVLILATNGTYAAKFKIPRAGNETEIEEAVVIRPPNGEDVIVNPKSPVRIFSSRFILSDGQKTLFMTVDTPQSTPQENISKFLTEYNIPFTPEDFLNLSADNTIPTQWHTLIKTTLSRSPKSSATT